MKILRMKFVPATVHLTLIALGALSGASAEFIRWERNEGGNGHFYAITDAASDWISAENTAVSMGGHLVSITSAAEQAFVVSNLVTGIHSNRPLWIGLADVSPHGGGLGSRVYFTWTSGEAIPYSNWNSGEPNNHAPGEDYGTINWHYAANQSSTKGTWNDAPLNGTTTFGGNSSGPYHGIVEIDVEPAVSLARQQGSNDTMVLTWTSVSNRLYEVQSSTNLHAGFSTVATNIPATPPANSLTNPVPAGPQVFWRVSTTF